jgi:hypothetical protein
MTRRDISDRHKNILIFRKNGLEFSFKVGTQVKIRVLKDRAAARPGGRAATKLAGVQNTLGDVGAAWRLLQAGLGISI